MATMLHVDGFQKDRLVYSFKYSINQPTDEEGQLTGAPLGGMLTIKVKSLSDNNADLFNWMVKPAMAADGTIKFDKDNGESGEQRVITFKNAFCVGYTEGYEKSGTDAHYEEVVLSCRTIQIGTIEYTHDWA